MTIQKTLQRNAAWIFFVLGFFILAGVSVYLYTVETKTLQSETNRAVNEATGSIRTNAQTLFRDLRTFTELGHFASQITNGTLKNDIDAFIRDRGTPFLYLESLAPSGELSYRYAQDPSQISAIQQTIDIEKTRLLKNIQSSQTFAISPPIQLPSGESALLFAAPLTFNNATSGIALGVIPVSYFYNTLNAVCSETGYRFSITLPYGGIVQSPDGQCIVDPTTSSASTSAWLHATRTIQIGDGLWEISVTHPSFQYRFTDIGSVIPFTVGGLFVLTVISFLYYRSEKNRELLELTLERENEFVSIVSHQLREPVSQMNAFIELLEDAWPPQAKKETRQLIEDLHTINQANAQIISNLLNVSRLQRNALKPQVQRHVLKGILEMAMKKTDAAREIHRIRIRIKPIGMGTLVEVDEHLACDVIQNILDNAFKYSPTDSEITVGADPHTEESFVTLAITDKGPGIPKPLQQVLFSKDKPQSAETFGSGAGLGLYISKKFMTLMGGRIRFKTSAKGTTFFLSFPKGNR